jgi:hypothetical protein
MPGLAVMLAVCVAAVKLGRVIEVNFCNETVLLS